MSITPAAHSVRSADGTRIAFDRSGDGPPLDRGEAAGHYRDFSPFSGLVPLLSTEFTVYADLTTELAELVGAGRNDDAVEHFHRSIGVPAEFIASMRSTPKWARMESVARTLVYDCIIADTTTPTLRSVAVPTLVLDSMDSTDDLTGWAATVAGQLPRASHRSLAGEWHPVPDESLAPVLVEFFHA